MPDNILTLLFAVLVFPGGLFALAFGLILRGLDRRAVARMQRRVGPPLIQPFIDILKLMGKRTMVPEGSNTFVFLWAPVVAVAAMAVAAAMIPIAGFYRPSAHLGDMLVLLYLVTVPAVVLMLAGSASGSPFGAIGFSREMAIMLAYEGPLLLAVVAVAMVAGRHLGQPIALSLADIVAVQRQQGAFILDPMLWPALLAYLSFIPANLGFSPFDVPEAESEVLEGPLLEYSGPALGLLKLASALKSVVVIGLGIALFCPIGPSGGAGLLVWALQCAVVTVCGVSLAKAALGRMRIDQAVLFYLKWPELLGIAGLVLAVANL